MNADTILQVNVETVAFLAGVVVPIVVGLLTKLNASSGVKAVLNLVLSIAVGALAAFTAHEGTLTVAQLVSACATAFVASGVSYNHFWKPTGAAPAVQEIAPNFGIGKAVQPVVEPAVGPVVEPEESVKVIGQEPVPPEEP